MMTIYHPRQDGSCSVLRHVGLLHSFAESILHALSQLETGPGIGSGRIFESKAPVAMDDRFDEGAL